MHATEPTHAFLLGSHFGLLLGLALVALNGFFVAAEFALVKVRPTQLQPRIDAGSYPGRLARHMLDHLDAYLSATQLGITLASLGLGWVGEPAFAWILEPLFRQMPGASPAFVHSITLTSAFLLITFLHIVVGEQAPKSFAIRRPQATSMWIAVPLYVFYWVTFPAIWLLNRASMGLLRMVGIRPMAGHGSIHSEAEVRLLVASHQGAQISDDKRALLENVFELFDRVARQVMVPRADVVFLSVSRSLEENLAIARTTGHTRFPLCSGDLDHILGIVHIKDLFRAEAVPKDLRPIARPVRFVPETTPLDLLLARMRTERLHLAAVVDEYGGVSGVVTLENVIEEIVGPIQDEFDAEKPELIDRGGGVYQVSGSMLVLDLEDELGLELSDRDEDTAAGLVLSELGRRPRVGDRVEIAGLRFEVLEVQGSRIRSLRLTRPSAAT